MLTIEGIIVNLNGQKRGRIEIDPASGLITKVGEPTGKADVILKDELIFPGFIDLHVHAREDSSHKLDYKEKFFSAGEAAINGGVVAFIDMINNPIPTIDEESYKTRQLLTAESKVEIILSAGIGPNTKPLKLHVPYKVFMTHSVGDLFFKTKVDLENTLKNYRGECVSFHSEDPDIIEKLKNAGTHEEKRPKIAEISGIEFALYLIKKYKIKGRICHVSTPEGSRKVVDAKKQGIDAVCEITPHHLFFDTSMINELNRKWLTVNPPIRNNRVERLEMIKQLKEGQIDFLGTDHAPHTREEKLNSISGIPHLDTYGSFVTWLMKEHNFTPQEIIRICSFNPGQFINQFTSDQYGQVASGFIGSLTILDTNKPIKITKDILKTKCQWSPFEGITFPGSVVMTIIKGEILKNEIQ